VEMRPPTGSRLKWGHAERLRPHRSAGEASLTGRRRPQPHVDERPDSALTGEEIEEASTLLASGMTLGQLVPRFHLSGEALRDQLAWHFGVGDGTPSCGRARRRAIGQARWSCARC
jgi:hypothetical protein